MKYHLASLHQFELRQCGFVLVRLAEGAAVQLGNLVGADDDRPRIARMHLARLSDSQSKCRRAGLFAGKRRFFDLGRGHVKGQAKAPEQFAAIARCRGEYDSRRAHGARSVAALSRVLDCEYLVMSLRAHTHIDAFELARDGATIEGRLPLETLPRLAAALARPEGELHYRLHGQLDEQGRPGARMNLEGILVLECQRCNKPFGFRLEREAHFRFVDSEEELNALPIEDDEVDVIVGARRMDVSIWIEDEAILSLPLVPRHEWDDAACRPAAELGATEEESSDSSGREHPFAVLAGLKPGSKAS